MNSIIVSCNQEEKSNLKCKIHKGLPLLFYEIQMGQNTEPTVCAKCVTANDLNGRNLLMIDDILNTDDNNVFLNWPIVDDRSILTEYKTIIEQKEDQNCILAILEEFFDNLQSKLSEKITQCKKKVFINMDNLFLPKDGLKNIYNTISQKTYFKELTEKLCNGEENSIREIQQLISEGNNKCKENTQTLLKGLNFYQSSEQALQLQIPNLYMEEIISIINQLQEWFLKGFSGDQVQSLDKQKYDYNNTVKDIISLVNNPTNFCKETFLTKLENCLLNIGPALPKFEPNSYLKEGKEVLNFSIMKEEQFGLLEKSIRSLMKMNDEIKSVTEDKIQNSRIFESVESQQKELQTYLKQFSYLQQKHITETKQQNQFEIDLTYKCSFIKSKQDGFSQSHQKIERNPQNILEISTKDSGWNVQSHYETLINPFTKYRIIIQLEPYTSFSQSYEFNIGIQKEKNCNNQWVSSSPYFFSNTSDSKFEHATKGVPLNDNSIKHERKMRQLEFQMCLVDKHFLIADYPDYTNVTIATEDQLSDLDQSKNYKLGIEIKSVQKVKIINFFEVSQFRPL